MKNSAKFLAKLRKRLDEAEDKRSFVKQFFHENFGLPSPRELGWSKHNALEDEDFSPDPIGKTWQDWHKHVKQLHPVRYFFVEALPKFFRYNIYWPIKRPIEKAHYWFVSHFIPSRRYHMLDLRQPGGYQYGWQDVPEKMLYAMFNLLGEYLNQEQPYDLTDDYTEEQIEGDVGMKMQHRSLCEARTIYHWWTVGKKEEEKAISDMRHQWWLARKAKEPQAEEHHKKLQELEDAFENKTDEMVARLMKIRRTLWT
jgi:hypothetical protein